MHGAAMHASGSACLQLTADMLGCHQLQYVPMQKLGRGRSYCKPRPNLLLAAAVKQQAVHVGLQRPLQHTAEGWQAPVAVVAAAALLAAAAWPRPAKRAHQVNTQQHTYPSDPSEEQATSAIAATEVHSSSSQPVPGEHGHAAIEQEQSETLSTGTSQGTPDEETLGKETANEEQWARLQGLGRLIIVSRRRPALQPGIEAEQGYFEQLLRQCTGGVKGPQPTGLLLAWRSCILLILEGGNNQLMVATRHLLLTTAQQHGMVDPRVISFVLDAQSRTFSHWCCAEVRMRDMGIPTMLQQAQWASGVRDVELFVRAVGTQLSGITQGAAQQMLRDPVLFLGDKLPAPKAVLSLAANELGPTLQGFLDAYDIDYKQYCDLRQQLAQLHEAGVAAEDPDMYSQHPQWRLLHGLYGAVWEAEMQERSATGKHEEKEATAPSPLAHLYPKKQGTAHRQQLGR